MTNHGNLLKELLSKQVKNIDAYKKLQFADMRRICKYISTSIFDQNKCCIWNGYITNINNSAKGTYINFYFQKKKKALHRLLYINFIGELTNNEYLKFSCENKGYCCNIYHLNKFAYRNPTNKKFTGSENTNKIKNKFGCSQCDTKNYKNCIICKNKKKTKINFTLTFD
jgi:hypothetical protein